MQQFECQKAQSTIYEGYKMQTVSALDCTSTIYQCYKMQSSVCPTAQTTFYESYQMQTGCPFQCTMHNAFPELIDSKSVKAVLCNWTRGQSP
jgi:hypothetical protein